MSPKHCVTSAHAPIDNANVSVLQIDIALDLDICEHGHVLDESVVVYADQLLEDLHPRHVVLDHFVQYPHEVFDLYVACERAHRLCNNTIYIYIYIYINI